MIDGFITEEEADAGVGGRAGMKNDGSDATDD
jgi:hypothetical protein